MRDFDYDCMQKKQLAHQAQHRKGGSKSKKCSLPSDYMTKKQWKERNGAIVSFSFDKPIKWKDFKKLPPKTQEEYLCGLVDRYSVSAVDMGEMFGVTPATLRNFIHDKSLSVPLRRGHFMDHEQRKAWSYFTDADKPEKLESVISCEPITHTPADPDLPTPAEPVDKEQTQIKLNHFSFGFTGELDPSEIYKTILYMIGEGKSGTIEVTCNLD